MHTEKMTKADERRVLHLDGDRERDVERVEDRNLDDHRQASAQRVNPMLAVELHRFALHSLGVAFMLGAQRIDLRLERLHRLHRPHALEREREEDDLREHGEEDDRHAIVMRVTVKPSQKPQDRNGNPLHREATIGLWYWETTEIYRFF